MRACRSASGCRTCSSLERNPYDRIGHFMQGFVPAMVAREILLRNKYVNGNSMAAFLSLCVALAVSAFYELVEWWAALALGQGADEFLGTQGDPWDTQADMFLALVGAARRRSPRYRGSTIVRSAR